MGTKARPFVFPFEIRVLHSNLFLIPGTHHSPHFTIQCLLKILHFKVILLSLSPLSLLITERDELLESKGF
jgi:hypothetical protein